MLTPDANTPPGETALTTRWLAGLALLLVVPAYGVGVTLSLLVAPGWWGNLGFVLAKLWFLLVPLLWTLRVDRRKVGLPRPTRQDWQVGLLLGLLMFGVIGGAYLWVGRRWIDLSEVRAMAQQVGGLSPAIALLGSLYWTLLNSLFEECVWRGFVYSKCEVLTPGVIAIPLSALFFTLHHMIGLFAYTHNWRVVAGGGLGVFAAGVIWSWCYRRYSSLWPGYFSHVLADLAIALVSWQILFQ